MRSSLVQGSPKRNITISRRKPTIRDARNAFGFEGDLFDRDREPSDQPRHLVQLIGIVIRDRLCQPNETFVIAHGGNFAGNDRWRRLQEISLDSWHLTTSMAPGMVKMVPE
jgi:hypothetical protein